MNVNIIDTVKVPDGIYDAVYFAYTCIIKYKGDEYKYKTDVGIRTMNPQPTKVEVIDGRGCLVDADTPITVNESNILSYDKFREKKVKNQQKTSVFEPLANDIIYVKDATDEWKPVKEPIEILQVTGILDKDTVKKIEETFVQNMPMAMDNVKIGSEIWLAAIIKQPGLSYNATALASIQCRVVNIFKGMSKLSNIK